MKLCCEHKMYLWSRSTHCQNFKTIPLPLAEILVIKKKNKELVTVSIATFSRERNFASMLSILLVVSEF